MQLEKHKVHQPRKWNLDKYLVSMLLMKDRQGNKLIHALQFAWFSNAGDRKFQETLKKNKEMNGIEAQNWNASSFVFEEWEDPKEIHSASKCFC